jgi:hypothetical protein
MHILENLKKIPSKPGETFNFLIADLTYSLDELFLCFLSDPPVQRPAHEKTKYPRLLDESTLQLGQQMISHRNSLQSNFGF